jgi:hypothetical protein
MYFLKEGLDLSRYNGYEGQIVPSPFLTQVDIKKLREVFLREVEIKSILNLGDGVFGSEIANPCCVFIASKGDKKDETKVFVADLSDNHPQDKEHIITNRNIPYEKVSQSLYENSHNFSFITGGFHAIEVILRLLKTHPPLSTFIDDEIQRGISSDYNQAFIVRGDSIAKINIEKEKCKPVITGHNISRFGLDYLDEYVLYLTREDNINNYPQIRTYLAQFRSKITCKEVRDEKHPWYSLHRPRNTDIFISPKLVGLTTTNRLIVALDEFGYYVMDSLYTFKLKKDVAHHFLLSLLNSSLLTFIYRYFAQEGKRVLPQVKAENLYPLPIRRINFTTPPEERTTLVESLKSKYNANEFDKIIQLVEECLPKDAEGNFITEEEKSDVVHDLLAFLAERMIEMNKEKNEEMKGFLEWFEREIGAKIETLTNKTKLKQYYDLGFDELLDILKKNKKKIPVNLSKRELQGNLKDEFERSMRKLRPLIERIERTDWLIDQVVYRLYGLSEEEMGVVEESA